MSFIPQQKKLRRSGPYFRVERSSKACLNAHPLRSVKLISMIGILCAAMFGLGGCAGHADAPVVNLSPGSMIKAVDLAVPAQIKVVDEGVHVSIAKNAWGQFVVQLDGLKLSPHATLRLPQMAGISFSAFQVLNAPVDLDDAEYIRQTDDAGLTGSVPRVLLPLPISNDSADLSRLKILSQHILIWIDLHTTDTAAAGPVTGQCVLADGQSAWSLPVEITIEDLTLPNEPHLTFGAPLNWAALSALYPDTFEAVPPRLLNRGDPRRTKLLALIDDCLHLAHENKTDLYLPQLQPIVKWPLGKIPEVDWTDFDSVTAPWLTGSAFTDHQPVGFWPLPAPDSLAGFDLSTRSQYWKAAADHFAQKQWLDRSPIVLLGESGGRVTQAESILLSAEARKILSAHPQVATLLPMNDEQIQLVTSANSNAIIPESLSRVIDVAPGLVSNAPVQHVRQRHWINASDSVIAAAGEQGTRSLAWLAYSRDASLVLCGNPLPIGNQPARADQLIWAYPGEKFGFDHPLATVQLKWLRQAEQDYEYLLLATPHHTSAMKICRLETRPVQLDSSQSVDALYSLFAGNTEPNGCEAARKLLVEQLINPSTKNTSVDARDLQTIRWFAAREKQNLVARSVNWKWEANSISATLSLDLFNPAGEMSSGGQLQWGETGDGWTIPTDSARAPGVQQFQVSHVMTAARFNLNKVSTGSRAPMTLNFLDDFTRQTVPCKLVLPVAVSERRQRALSLDGKLDEWFPADAIQLNQPLVNMLDRPSLQAGILELAHTPSSIYTSWSDDNFYLAFRLGGVAAADLRSTRNFVQYDQGRAWGEDLCELLIQPIYVDNTRGPLLHVVCKPGGSWVEQQIDQKTWQPFEACGLRYASGVDSAEKIWRGEVAMPWKAINAANHGRPTLLRFNFIQHQQANAQSASWAGPIDQSRDGDLTGLLMLKEP